MSGPLFRLVSRVRRRLFLRRLGKGFIAGCVVVLLLGAVVLLLLGHAQLRRDMLPLDDDRFLLRLAWLGAGVLLAGLIAACVAWLRRPSALDAALSLDRTFHLSERLTTCMSLGKGEAASPAGEALLADTVERAGKLKVAQAYALRPSRASALVPVAAVVAILAALFCDVPPAQTNPDAKPVDPGLKTELEAIARGLKEMAKKEPQPKDRKQAPRGDEKTDINAEVEKLAGQKPGTRDEAKDLLKDMTSLEDRMRRHEQGLADRADALKKQAEEAARLSKKKKPGEQPTPREQALTDGDFKKAADELKRLVREMENDALTPEQREKLEKEMEDLRDKLDRLADVKAKQTKDAEKENKLSKEDLEQLKELEAADMADLREAAEDLQEVEDALKQGDDAKAAKKLEDAAKKLGKLDKRGDQQNAGEQLAMLQRMKERLGRGLGQAQPASGKRPDRPQDDSQGQDTRAKADRSKGGLGGFRLVPGAGLREPRSAQEVRGLLDEASREAAEALQRQRLPRSDADLTRGFYERLRGPDSDKK